MALPEDTLHPPRATANCIGKLALSNIVETVDGIHRLGQGRKKLFPILIDPLVN